MLDYVVRFRHNRSVDFSTYRVVTARSRDEAWVKVTDVWPWATNRHVSDYHPGAADDEDFLRLNSSDSDRLRTIGPFSVSAPLSFGTISSYVLGSTSDEAIRNFKSYFPSARDSDISVCCTSNSEYQFGAALQNLTTHLFYVRFLIASTEIDVKVLAVSKESARSKVDSRVPGASVLAVVKEGEPTRHIFRAERMPTLSSLTDEERTAVWKVTVLDRNGRRAGNTSHLVLAISREQVSNAISGLMQSLRTSFRVDPVVYIPRSSAKTIEQFLRAFDPDTGNEYAFGVMENGVLKFLGHPCTYRNLGVTLTKCWANARLFRSSAQAECMYSAMHNDLSEFFGLSEMVLYVREQKAPPKPAYDDAAPDGVPIDDTFEDDDDDDDYQEEMSSAEAALRTSMIQASVRATRSQALGDALNEQILLNPFEWVVPASTTQMVFNQRGA